MTSDTMNEAIAQKRWEVVQDLLLQHGNHAPNDHAMCVMEAVAYVAGEEWSDHPACACPVLTEYCIGINERFGDAARQRLKPYIPRLAGSKATPEVELRRAFLCADRAVRVFAVLALGLAGKDEEAEKLKALPEIVDEATARAASDAARAASAAARAASDAASAARYAASYARYAASDASDAASYARAARYAASDASDASDAASYARAARYAASAAARAARAASAAARAASDASDARYAASDASDAASAARYAASYARYAASYAEDEAFRLLDDLLAVEIPGEANG